MDDAPNLRQNPGKLMLPSNTTSTAALYAGKNNSLPCFPASTSTEAGLLFSAELHTFVLAPDSVTLLHLNKQPQYPTKNGKSVCENVCSSCNTLIYIGYYSPIGIHGAFRGEKVRLF